MKTPDENPPHQERTPPETTEPARAENASPAGGTTDAQLHEWVSRRFEIGLEEAKVLCSTKAFVLARRLDLSEAERLSAELRPHSVRVRRHLSAATLVLGLAMLLGIFELNTAAIAPYPGFSLDNREAVTYRGWPFPAWRERVSLEADPALTNGLLWLGYYANLFFGLFFLGLPLWVCETFVFAIGREPYSLILVPRGKTGTATTQEWVTAILLVVTTVGEVVFLQVDSSAYPVHLLHLVNSCLLMAVLALQALQWKYHGGTPYDHGFGHLISRHGQLLHTDRRAWIVPVCGGLVAVLAIALGMLADRWNWETVKLVSLVTAIFAALAGLSRTETVGIWCQLYFALGLLGVGYLPWESASKICTVICLETMALALGFKRWAVWTIAVCCIYAVLFWGQVDPGFDFCFGVMGFIAFALGFPDTNNARKGP